MTLIKKFTVKGTSRIIEPGTPIESIRLVGDPAEVECNTDTVKGRFLKTA